MGGQWTPRTPDWVMPPASQIADLHWLAYGLLMETRRPWPAGVACTIAWIRGGRNAPVTERPEQPVTRNLAESERWAAEAARDPCGPPPLDLIYEQLKVAPYPPPVDLDMNYCVGVWNALCWLLQPEGYGVRVPIPVPRRHPDGRLYTADDLYAEIIRDGRLSPEQRAAERIKAEVAAGKYLYYDEQIRRIQRDLGWGAAAVS